MRAFLKKDRNLGLDEAQFTFLVQQLQKGDEQLFEQIFCRFFKKNLSLLKHKYQAEHEEAYDCVMWAMLRMRQMLIEDKVAYGNIENYFSRIAVTRYIKLQSRKKEISTENIPESMIGEDTFVDDEMIEILNKAWEQLDDSCKTILKAYYYDKIELKKLSEIINDSSAANTRKKKERCLKKLRTLFFKMYGTIDG